ncbi:hypothetical protein OJF2_71310 [Aquisphaera giovannonii]|uniref:Uncharacterized protein n=1 Tax=Aquisphaera giovannonii TaxID=406548 RepID=A0A5B9WCY2_9BACT|nr:hypothetical protein [Aquisphaera giovannonii]QEH38528.1 hypothetical protein OJF2_71310 [Aquisphaera giovannonii]
MSVRRPARVCLGRLIGIALLIPGLFHVPLPQADFHNVRHHDGDGELCPNHEHLLRWHPSAGAADDVAMLHWHWLPPNRQGGSPPETDGLSNDLGHRGVPAGPALHAYLPLDATAPDWGRTVAIDPDPRRGANPPAPGLDGMGAAPHLIAECPQLRIDPGRLAAAGCAPRAPAAPDRGCCQRLNC